VRRAPPAWHQKRHYGEMREAKIDFKSEVVVLCMRKKTGKILRCIMPEAKKYVYHIEYSAKRTIVIFNQLRELYGNFDAP